MNTDTHEIDACYDNGESWTVICSCSWEAWNFASESAVRAIYAEHVANPVPNDPRESSS